jgi:probable F420-dependent oxidoreductase
MEVHSGLFGSLKEIPQEVSELEAIGYSGIFSAEMNNDPFFPLLLAAEHSKKVELSTCIAVAFARNPMTVANLAHDLNQYSDGRFVLGLGSQIKAHITRRYSMPWSKPAARMREFVQAMRAIWDCWENGTPLNFEGEFYQHTLMTPMFVPKQMSYGAPKVNVAGVGPLMTEVAGEVADGLMCHGFTSSKYMQELTLPALERGLAKSGRHRDDFRLYAPIVVVSGHDEESFQANWQAMKWQLAFYGSTPAYKGVLECHNMEALHTDLLRLSKQGKWDVMAELVDDDFVEQFAIVCEDPKDIPQQLHQRFGHLIDVWMQTYQPPAREPRSDLIRGIRVAAGKVPKSQREK